MILMKTVLVFSMIGIQLATSVEVAHHQDAEEIEYLKQLVKRLTLRQNTILKGLIKSAEKQSSKIKGANENEVGDRNRNKVLGILEDTDEEDLDGMINKTYDDKDIEKVMDNMSDTELKVVLKNVEDQELGELVTAMNDQDFNEVMRNLKGDTEEISMARDIVKMIQSEELDDLTHQKLEQHGKELSQSRKRRDLNDVLGENIEKNRRKRETDEGFQGFSSSDVLTTIAGHQKQMANIVEKEKKSRERKRRATDILEKQKDHLRWREAEEMFKEPTYLAPNFEPEGESEERKKAAGYLGLLSLYEHSRKRRHAIKKGENLDEDSDGIESLATGDRQKRGLPGLDWLFAPHTTINSLIGHQAEPDTNREPYFNQDFLNPFSLLRSEPDTNSEPYLDQDFLPNFTKFRSEPHSYPESQTTYSEPKITHQTQWTYSEPEPKFKPSYHEPEAEPEPESTYEPEPEFKPEPSYHEPEPEPESEPESTYEHQPTPSAEPLLEPELQSTDAHEPTCTESDPSCQESQPISHPEDTHGDHDDHYHHHTTISLGSDIYELVSPISTATTADTPYRTSAEKSTLTKNNVPYEKLTLSNGAPKKTTIYFSGHSTPLKNSHMDTLKSVKLPHELEGLSFQNNAPNKPTILIRQHSKPLNSHMDTLKSVKMPHDAAPTVASFSWTTFKERQESARPQISHRMKSAKLEKNVPNVLKRSNF